MSAKKLAVWGSIDARSSRADQVLHRRREEKPGDCPTSDVIQTGNLRWVDNHLNPEDWVRKLINNSLRPIKILFQPVTGKLLDTFFAIARRAAVGDVAIEKSDYFVQQYVQINYQGQRCFNLEETTDAYSFLEHCTEIHKEEWEEKVVSIDR
ncbi:hypothetical protein PV328_001044 [Microctonus aethiopoides]|uniref:Uncharacterized protein n=1 Tax=Microctonus aethiopoides TaxID=144406 RepID=A0AA39FWM6_9HYME|nr:hypothetical protein PV328_001044 [Microctonus aethiopoides]